MMKMWGKFGKLKYCFYFCNQYHKKSIIETTLFADEILKPRLFTSVLFYHGMLTIKGKYGSQDILGIPNNNVQRVIERAVSK